MYVVSTFFQNLTNPNLQIINYYSSSTKFFWEMNYQEKAILQKEMQNGFNELKKLSQDATVDLIIVDELLECIYNELISEAELIEVIQKNLQILKWLFLAIILLIINLINAVDLVSHVQATKHYFYQKVPAHKGIEY
nr:cob(I)yrinic acid a,c-diamide adenosyltransferase [Spiroplasma phoeniceum]